MFFKSVFHIENVHFNSNVSENLSIIIIIIAKETGTFSYISFIWFQLTFDTFTVGRFVSYTLDGCPDGYMSIRESQLPDTGGQWCGSAWGFTVYYSETRSINLTLTLSKLSEQVSETHRWTSRAIQRKRLNVVSFRSAVVSYNTMCACVCSQGIGYNFDFKLSYKYLKKSDAHLRYGNSTFQTWRGQMITGSYCDRILEQCDRKPCRVQSPNFPGAYPRNVTCYYRIEQRTVPKSKRALIVVRQPNAHKIHIKDQVINYDRSQRTLRYVITILQCPLAFHVRLR